MNSGYLNLYTYQISSHYDKYFAYLTKPWIIDEVVVNSSEFCYNWTQDTLICIHIKFQVILISTSCVWQKPWIIDEVDVNSSKFCYNWTQDTLICIHIKFQVILISPSRTWQKPWMINEVVVNSSEFCYNWTQYTLICMHIKFQVILISPSRTWQISWIIDEEDVNSIIFGYISNHSFKAVCACAPNFSPSKNPMLIINHISGHQSPVTDHLPPAIGHR